MYFNLELCALQKEHSFEYNMLLHIYFKDL